jgi:prepilin-type processing-associated H-X9-DG protein
MGEGEVYSLREEHVDMSERCSRGGKGLAECATGGGILAILAMMLIPVCANVRLAANVGKCQENLTQIGLALRLYMQDHDNRYPCSSALCEAFPTTLRPYVKSEQVFLCPSDADRGALPGCLDTSYGLVFGSWADAKWGDGQSIAARPLAEFARPAATLIGADAKRREDMKAGGYIYILRGAQVSFTGAPQGDFAPRHYDGTNVLFLDGHVTWLKTTALKAGLDTGVYRYN